MEEAVLAPVAASRTTARATTRLCCVRSWVSSGPKLTFASFKIHTQLFSPDGGVGLVAALDPLLLALPLLEASRGVGVGQASPDSPGQFRDAEQALGEVGPAGAALLAALAAVGGGESATAAGVGEDGEVEVEDSPTPPTPSTAAAAAALAAATSALASICKTRTVGPDTYVRLDDARALA